MTTTIRAALRYSLLGLTSALGLASAANAEITVTTAEISGGQLVVNGTRTGTGAPPQMRLDGLYLTPIASGSGAFSFNLVYIPRDCIATLEAIRTDGGVREALDVVIANCGPAGINPRGEWSSTRTYVENDVVTGGGNAWRAKANAEVNKGKKPINNPDFWE